MWCTRTQSIEVLTDAGVGGRENAVIAVYQVSKLKKLKKIKKKIGKEGAGGGATLRPAEAVTLTIGFKKLILLKNLLSI